MLGRQLHTGVQSESFTWLNTWIPDVLVVQRGLGMSLATTFPHQTFGHHSPPPSFSSSHLPPRLHH